MPWFIPKWLQVLERGQSEARIQELHAGVLYVGPRVHALGLLSAALPGTLAGSSSRAAGAPAWRHM